MPTLLQRPGSAAQYRPSYGAQQQPRFPDTYPPGPLPINAAPPGQPRSLRFPQKPHTQAKYTTYDSRMRTGVSGLVQPIHVTGGPNEAFTPSSVFNSSNAPLNTGVMTPTGEYGRGGRSRRTKINYAEVEEDDFGDGEEGSEAQAKKMVDIAKEQEGWSWLGERTPGNRVRSRMAPPALANLPFVCVTAATPHEPADSLSLVDPKMISRERRKNPSCWFQCAWSWTRKRIEYETTLPGTSTVGQKTPQRSGLTDYIPPVETLISPEDFAITFCRDLNISGQYYRDQIAVMIRQQVAEYSEVLVIDAMEDGDNDVEAEDAVDEDEQVSTGKEKVNKQSTEKISPEEDDLMEADCRVIVNVGSTERSRRQRLILPAAGRSDIHLQPA